MYSMVQWFSPPNYDYQVGLLGLRTLIKEKNDFLRGKEETMCIQTKKKQRQVIINGSLRLILIIRWDY